MELIILPFCVPLLLLGYVVDALDARRERQRAVQKQARQQELWRETWFQLNGAPNYSAQTTVAPRSQSQR